MPGLGAAASDPPVTWTVPAPGVAVIVPPHVLELFGADATVRPAGSVSVRLTGDMAAFVKLSSSIVRVEIPPFAIVVGENDLSTRPPGVTVRIALVAG